MPYTFTYNTNTSNNNDIDEMPQVVSSPNISTPYLDSSIDTPYLDNNSNSPFLDTFPDFSPYLMYASLGPVPPYVMGGLNGKNLNDNKDDVCIARYLDGYENKNIAKLTHDPIAKFNGDPSALLIDKSKSPAINTHITNTKPSPTLKLENITEEKSDSLFPPLSSSQASNSNSYNDVSSYDDAFERRESIDDILNFEANSPLSAEEENEYEMQEEKEAQQTTKSTEHKTNESPEPKKRKRDNTTTTTSHETKKHKSNVKTAKPRKPAKETKTFQCPLCDHVSKRRYNLSTHIKTHDKSRIKEFTCSQCTKRFDRRHDRDRHLATVHRGERSFTCDHCTTTTTTFSRRDALDRHLIQKHNYDESDFAE